MGQESKVLSRTVSTGSTGTLADVGGADPSTDKRRHVSARIVSRLFDSASIDDIDDVRDSDRGLGNVGRKNDSASTIGRGLKDLTLLRRRNTRVKDVDRGSREVEPVRGRSRVSECSVERLDGLETVAEDKLSGRGRTESEKCKQSRLANEYGQERKHDIRYDLRLSSCRCGQ